MPAALALAPLGLKIMDIDWLAVDALECRPGVFKPEITAGHPARAMLIPFLADAEFATADEAKAYAMQLLRGDLPSEKCAGFECAATPSLTGWQPWIRRCLPSAAESPLEPRQRVGERSWPTEAEALQAARRAAVERTASGQGSA